MVKLNNRGKLPDELSTNASISFCHIRRVGEYNNMGGLCSAI